MLSTLRANQQEMTQAVSDGYLAMLREKEAAKQDEYIRAREYYEGIHKTQLTERTRTFLNLKHDADFNANYCHMVVNAKADRLSITGFKTDDSKEATDTDKAIMRWWKRNRMDRIQGIVHHAAIRDGDAFMLVEWDAVAKLPRFHYEPAFAGDGVMVYYSDERRDEIAFASKHWRISLGGNAGTMRRLNLYFPDRVEKYVSRDTETAGRWQAFTEDENTEVGQGYLGQAGIVWWTDNGQANGLPLGIPIVHFKNNDTGNEFGITHLAHVMPLQDALNKSLIDLIAAMDINGFPLMVGFGDDWTVAKTGPGAIISTNASSSEADFKVEKGLDPSGLIAAYNALVMEIARVSGTPLSYLQSSGQVAAEGTMKQQETALISQVQKAQIDFGNAWEDVMAIACRLSMAFGDSADAIKLDEDMMIEAVWKDAQIRNEKEQAETLAIKVTQLGVSEEQAQVEMDYSPEQRESFAKAKLENEARAMKNAVTMQSEQAKLKQGMNQTDNEAGNKPPPQTGEKSA